MIETPSWIPFKDYFTDNQGDEETWVQKSKTISIVAAAFLLMIDIMVTLATIFGK